jgi:methionine-gamma-lyase
VIDPNVPYDQALARRAAALATLCVHAGEQRDERTGALDTPIVLSSAFGFAGADEAAGAFRGENDAYIYGRWGNPTVDALEEKLAALEGAETAVACASGMAAISGAVLAFCEQGSHIVAPRSMYGESARLLRERLPKLGVRTTFVDASAPGAYEGAIEPSTKLLYLETPSNPILGLTDIATVTAYARSRGIVTVVDSTFATPFSQTPLALGADLVVHSMTKGMGGHGDAIGGCVAGPRAHVDRARDTVVKGFGGVMSPHTAHAVARGLRTLALRQWQSCASAATLATRLAAHPRVARVHHPSLATHPGHALARQQMHAFGSLLSFELCVDGVVEGVVEGKSAVFDAARRVLNRVRVVTHAVSLGDARTLLVHPASTTHSTMSPPDRERADITNGLLRLSVGLEAVEDLWADLSGALAERS